MNAAASTINPALLDREVTSFSIDSREVQAGDVFFALSQPDYKNNGFNGDFEDATKYVAVAFEKGAVACVVRPDRYEEHKADLEQYHDRMIFVDDAILALQNLAHGVYLEWDKPVVAITGSAGKTTAKELTAHVLSASGRKVLRNQKNYNNGLGHPLTVLNLAKDDTYDVAVLEMGMSTPMNEIQRLCRITPPDVAVELNVLPVHVEHLGSIENVARAKAELVEGMKPGGTAVLNADDQRVAAMRDLAKGSVLTYGIESEADVTASEINFARFGETSFILKTPDGKAQVGFPLNGKHNILNALAAAAVGHTFGQSASVIAERLSTVAPPPQRGEILHFKGGFTVINDSYNSNPTALLSMVQTLVDGAGSAARKIVVAGEMLELGERQGEIHVETGREIAVMGIELLVGVRGLGRELIEGAKTAGLRDAVFIENSDLAGEYLANEIKPGDVVLIKGSRGVRTEKVVEKLLERYELEEERDAAKR
ncbi:MAG TPA: UDP-N-acetylmuramoyl-tripeptide--D-alanyl-D-alanine ligase [Pyrinomonadaceae bacterium]|jgi:UDP-N-acetylmuramoyl-tripeptide--D-alanyl-D-alanine ligase|nr:UDP-N-acetylmuramoyl-tripeptide--D-alanyl-D-alanine ligase [Pyrinomonadaceae bacterium]